MDQTAEARLEGWRLLAPSRRGDATRPGQEWRQREGIDAQAGAVVPPAGFAPSYLGAGKQEDVYNDL